MYLYIQNLCFVLLNTLAFPIINSASCSNVEQSRIVAKNRFLSGFFQSSPNHRALTCSLGSKNWGWSIGSFIEEIKLPQSSFGGNREKHCYFTLSKPFFEWNDYIWKCCLLISWFPKPPSSKSYLIAMKTIMHYLFKPLEGSSVCNHIHIKEEFSLHKSIGVGK